MVGTSEQGPTLTEADVLTQLASDFWEHPHTNLNESTDEYTRFISGFVIMSSQFIQFVDSYRRQDSIGIEQGYQHFAPAWKVLGQHKYLEAHFDQLDTLNQDFDYQTISEYRRHRCTRTYPAETGKNALANDEIIEVKNRELGESPGICTLVGFCRQGHLVGVNQKSKRFTTMFYGPGDIDERVVHRSCTGSKNNQTPEKKVIYEVSQVGRWKDYLKKNSGLGLRQN